MTPERIATLRTLHTPLVSDAMDRLGIAHCVMDRAVQSVMHDPHVKICGPAFPCRVVPTQEYVEIDTLLAMVDAIPKDSIVVVAADVDIDAALWGGLMSTRAQSRGAVGAVVNGGVRDLEQIADAAFPVFGTYRSIKDIRRRGFMHSYGVPVTCGDVAIAPGDIVFGDANGVVVIPQQQFDAVFEELRLADAEERSTMEALQRGADAAKVFEQYGRF